MCFVERLLFQNVLTALSLSGTLNHLKETFTHTPSYDMSPAMLSMLIRMMLAQAQECLFEKIALPGIQNQFQPLMKMAQEAAKVNKKITTYEILDCVLCGILFSGIDLYHTVQSLALSMPKMSLKQLYFF